MLLTDCDLFTGYQSEEIEQILETVPHATRKYKKGDMIALQGDLINAIYILAQGKAHATMSNDAGKQILIEELSAPTILASAFIFATVNCFPVNVECIKICEIIIIKRDDFLPLIQREKKLLSNFLSEISNRSVFQTMKIKSFALSGLKQRLAEYLLQTTHQINGVEIKETQQEIADRMGVARPSLARIIALLIEDGALEVIKKKLYVRNVSKLHALTK